MDCHQRIIKMIAFNLIIIKLTLTCHRGKKMQICIKLNHPDARFIEIVCTYTNNPYQEEYFVTKDICACK